MTMPNFFLDLLEEQPQVGYAGFLEGLLGGQGGQGFSPNRQRFLQSQFNPTFNRYQGALGQQIMRGQTPDLRFMDFLQNFGLGQLGGGFSPQERGEGTGQFAPRTQWMLGR